MAGPIETELGIVVGAIDYGDADRIVTFLTSGHGRLRGLARSAKKSQKRFGGCLEPCVKVRVHFRERPGAELASLDSCELVDPRSGLRGELARMTAALYGAELAGAFAVEKDAGHALFEGLDAYLDEAARGDGFDLGAVRAFELRTLDVVGLRPELERCVACGADPFDGRPHRFSFSLREGGLLCARCGEGAHPLSLSPGTARTLAAVLRGERVAFTRAALDESGVVLGALIEGHLGRLPRSRAFLSL